MFRLIPAILLAAAVATAGCSTAPADSTAPAIAAADTGSQNITGTAPPASGNFPSLVILEPIGGGTPTPQTTTPTMDQVQQTFIPSILLVRTGQPVDFFNHDEVLHNVRVKDDDTKESAFNVAIPTGEKFTHTFERDGFYDVGCDIHPGMSAQILSTTNPWTVVADPSGAFSIANLPNGPYKATVYAGAQTVETEVNIGAGATALDLRK